MGEMNSDTKPSSSTRLYITTPKILVHSHTVHQYTLANQTLSNPTVINSTMFSLKMIIAISCSGVGVLTCILALYIRYKKRKSDGKLIGNKSQLDLDDSNYDMIETPPNETGQNPIENPYYGMDDDTSRNSN